MDWLLVFLKEEDRFCLFSCGEIQERRLSAEDQVGFQHTLVDASILHECSMIFYCIYRHNNKCSPFQNLMS